MWPSSFGFFFGLFINQEERAMATTTTTSIVVCRCIDLYFSMHLGLNHVLKNLLDDVKSNQQLKARTFEAHRRPPTCSHNYFMFLVYGKPKSLVHKLHMSEYFMYS
jgi:hypothetical protein